MAENQRLQFQPRGGAMGVATAFDEGEYQTSGLSYPSDLLSPNNPYGNNFVVFYINVHEDSMLVKENAGSAYIDPSRVAPRERGASSGLSATGVKTLAAIGGAVGAQTADIAGKITTGLGASKLQETVNTVSNVAIGGMAGLAAVAAVGGANKQYKRQRKAIALYVPNEMSIKYGVNWQETDLAGSIEIAMGAENISKLKLSALGQDTASYLAGLAMKTPGAGELLSKSSAMAMNPKKEQVFKDVDYRTFSFNYQFFPRSKKEAQDVRNIIKEFKLHMHPEFKPNTGQYLFLYPSEFDIFYYNNGTENMNLHRHTSCVLTDMSVVYSPQGQFTSFDDGMPSQVNISLTFRELAILTKENILDGY